jgi:hypothetical protein
MGRTHHFALTVMLNQNVLVDEVVPFAKAGGQ